MKQVLAPHSQQCEACRTKPTVSSARSYGDTEEGGGVWKGFQEEGVEE